MRKLTFLLALGTSLFCISAADKKTFNVLFIGVDDLRPQLNSYGYSQMKTPNFDRLAKMGMQFNRAYVQQAVCAASRASILTGCRPDSTGVNYPYSPWFNLVFKKKYKPIAEYFAKQDFYTRTLGKIHHGPSDKGLSEEHFSSKAPDFLLPENQHEGKKSDYIHKVKPWEHADLADNLYVDGQIADETIATIRRAVKQEKPFFIASGFKKPHLPFVCPKKYHDLYSDSDIKFAMHPKLGLNQGDFTTTASTGASKWWKYPKTGIDKQNARQLIHSYYACVSFIDAQIGKILDELNKQNLMESTIVIVWSDHGWHLGDHGMWGKSTNYEWSTRAPLFAYVPGMKGAGTSTDALVEYVDLFPTALELCGLQVPDYLEGNSFAPVLQDAVMPWKTAAFSQFPRGKLEGYSMRTKDYRYTQWQNKSGEIVSEELYDERQNLLEAENLAKSPEYQSELEALRNQFSKGWKGALPAGLVNHSALPRGDDSWYNKSKKEQALEKASTKKSKKSSGDTSENKEWLKKLLLKSPAADANGDGILSKEEAVKFKIGKK